MTELAIISMLKAVMVLSLIIVILPLIWNIEKKIFLGIQKKKFKPNLGYYAELLKRSTKRENYKILASESHAPLLRLFTLIFVTAIMPWCEPFYFRTNKIYSEIMTIDYCFLFAVFVLIASSLADTFSIVSKSNAQNKINLMQEISNISSVIISLIVVLITILLVYGSADLHMIVQNQSAYLWSQSIPSWGIFTQPVSAIIFIFLVYRLNKSFASIMTGYFLDLINGPLFLFLSSLLFSYVFLAGYNILPGLKFLSVYTLEFHYIFQTLSLLVKTIFVMYFIILIKWSASNTKAEFVMSYLNGKILAITMINFFVTCSYIYMKGVL